jgi:hypothetical protein
VITLDDGELYGVVHAFSTDRVLILYEGLYVFADRKSSTTFQLSMTPAQSGAEQDMLLSLVKAAPSLEVTVTKDDGE